MAFFFAINLRRIMYLIAITEIIGFFINSFGQNKRKITNNNIIKIIFSVLAIPKFQAPGICFSSRRHSIMADQFEGFHYEIRDLTAKTKFKTFVLIPPWSLFGFNPKSLISWCCSEIQNITSETDCKTLVVKGLRLLSKNPFP